MVMMMMTMVMMMVMMTMMMIITIIVMIIKTFACGNGRAQVTPPVGKRAGEKVAEGLSEHCYNYYYCYF